jgi:RNA polymerase sigma factor (TIGR02999 family)
MINPNPVASHEWRFDVEPMDPNVEITVLLREAAEGDRAALDRAFEQVYGELRRLAGSQRRRWEGDYTLNTTALVHEAYVKMVGSNSARFKDRSHFLAVAARAMRQILVNYAERRRAARRGGGAAHVELDERMGEFNPLTHEAAVEVLALHEALERLAEMNERQARVVEARFFAGLDLEGAAQAVGISLATVKRDWALASAWLHRELSEGKE